jgi:hypothetical protein
VFSIGLTIRLFEGQQDGQIDFDVDLGFQPRPKLKFSTSGTIDMKQKDLFEHERAERHDGTE